MIDFLKLLHKNEPKAFYTLLALLGILSVTCITLKLIIMGIK